MAKAVINLQKESGGIVKISPVDGTGVTELVVPESGNLVSVGTAVTDNAIARYDGTTGKLQNSGVRIDDINNIATTGNVTTTVFDTKLGLNESTGALTSMNGSSTAWRPLSLLYGNGPLVIKDASTDSERLTIDASGNVLVKSGTGALGYGAGAGGSVTQLTSKSTEVTLNKPSGQIIMHNSTLLSGETTSFYLNNSLLSMTDQLFVTFGAGSYSASVYNVWGYAVNGLAQIFVKNTSGASLSESVVIRFSIIKGSNA